MLARTIKRVYWFTITGKLKGGEASDVVLRAPALRLCGSPGLFSS